jgi:hypothetical protein
VWLYATAGTTDHYHYCSAGYDGNSHSYGLGQLLSDSFLS